MKITKVELLVLKSEGLYNNSQGAEEPLGPDFTVTFKTHTPFNVEVRRIRSVEMDDGDPEARTGKLMAVLCDKVRQMPPSIINLLWLIAEREISEADFWEPVTTVEAWFGDEEKANAAQFQKLQKTLDILLTERQVFRVGQTEIDVYLLGKPKDGPRVGLKTKVVET